MCIFAFMWLDKVRGNSFCSDLKKQPRFPLSLMFSDWIIRCRHYSIEDLMTRGHQNNAVIDAESYEPSYELHACVAEYNDLVEGFIQRII